MAQEPNPKRRELKIASIGAWGHLGRVLAEFDATDDLRILAMSRSPAGEDPRTYQQAHPSARDASLFDDHRRMLDEVKPDVVIISTRVDLLAPLAIEAAQRGCHLLCEKPLSLDQATLADLWKLCRARGVECRAILDNHVQPALVAAREAVAHGRLGRVALINTRKSYKWGNRPEWFGRRALYGGTIPWIGIHALDFMYTLTGQPFATVAAMHGNASHPERAECEDQAAMIVRLADGTHATASLDLLRPAAADTHGDDWIRVVGSGGTLEANITRGTCTITTESEPARALPLGAKSLAFIPFLASIAADRPAGEPSPEMRRAFLLTHASLCARDAADRHAIIQIRFDVT